MLGERANSPKGLCLASTPCSQVRDHGVKKEEIPESFLEESALKNVLP